MVGLIDELGLERAADRRLRHRQPDRAGDRARHARSRCARWSSRRRCPGAGRRILSPEAMREFWYQSFHQLSLIEEILDGDRAAVRAYLAHFWHHWSGPATRPADARLDHLAAAYGAPGAMTASIGWYRRAPAASPARWRRPARAADRHAHHGAVAGARPALPARLVRPARRVLQRRRPAPARRRRALHARRGARGVRRGDPRSGASSRSRAARRARCRRGPSAPPSPPGGRAR